MDANLTDKAQRLASEIATQAKTLEDLNGVVKLMMKSALERMLDTELDVHLGCKRSRGPAADPSAQIGESSAAEAPSKKGAKNRRNGHSQKTVQGDLGEIKLTTPRDRDGTFEPQLIPKHQRRLTGFDEKILALLRQGDDHTGHPRNRERTLRRRCVSNLDLRNHRRSRCSGVGMAQPATRRGLADCLPRWHRGACARRQCVIGDN